MRPQRRRTAMLDVAELEGRTLMAAQGPSGVWLGQDGHDLVGLAPNSTSDDIQDLHFAVSGLPAARTVARVEVLGYGGGQWFYNGPPGPAPAAWVQSPGATAADLYIDPYQVETGREFTINLTYDDSTSATFYVQGGAADPNLRMPNAAVSARWVGQDGRDLTGPGPSVGPDGVQDVVIALAGLSAGVAISSVDLVTAAGTGWSFGTNPFSRSNAELVRLGDDPTRAELFVNPAAVVAGQALTLTIRYANDRTDMTTLVAGPSDPGLRLSTGSPIPVSWGPVSAAWVGQDGIDLTGTGDVHVSLSGLPAGRTVISAMLSDPARTNWIYQSNGATATATDPNAYAVAFRRSVADPSRGDLSFPPTRDETGATLTLSLTLDDGTVVATRFAGGSSDLGRRAPAIAPTSVVARPGDDLALLVTQYGTVHLSAGTYALPRPLMLTRPVAITADAGATLLFSQGAADPAWTTAINVECGNTTLDGFAVRFSGPIRWTSEVNSGPSVIGSSNALDGGPRTPLVNIRLSHLDLVSPPPSSTWEEAPRLIWMANALSGVITGNAFKGGLVEFYNGPWQVTDNRVLGTVPNTYTYSAFASHSTHDVVVANNTVQSVGPSGKTWRFLVMTVSGYNDVVRDNNVVGVGPMDNDTVPNPNAPEVILTEAYRLHFEGAPTAIYAGGWVVQIPTPQGGPARTGDAVAILSGPEAGQWRLIAQALSPTTYLLDAPMAASATAISISTGFVGETFRSNTIDSRGSSSADDLVLVGNHFGTQVIGNHFLGGRYGFRISASPTELPDIWGWSHDPFLGATIQGNVLEDTLLGGTLNVEHGAWVKTSSGRTYMAAALLDNTVAWSDAFLAAYQQRNPSGRPGTFTVGDLTTAGPGELWVTARGNIFQGPPSVGPGVTWLVNSATINGQSVVNQSLPFSSAVVLAAPTGLRLVVDSGSSGSDGVTNDGRVTFNAVADAAGYEYSLSGNEGTYRSLGTATTFLPSGLVQGANSVFVRAFDPQGRRGPAATLALVYDTIGPPAVSGLTAFRDGRVRFQATGPGDVYEYRPGGSTTFVTLGSSTSFTAPNVLKGPRTVQVHAIDPAGNLGIDALTNVVPQWMPVIAIPPAKAASPSPSAPRAPAGGTSISLAPAFLRLAWPWPIIHGRTLARGPRPFRPAPRPRAVTAAATKAHADPSRPRAPAHRRVGQGIRPRSPARHDR